jgi:hypothetical protein
MKEEGINSLSVIFKKVVEQDLVTTVLEKSIYTAMEILKTDG